MGSSHNKNKKRKDSKKGFNGNFYTIRPVGRPRTRCITTAGDKRIEEKS